MSTAVVVDMGTMRRRGGGYIGIVTGVTSDGDPNITAGNHLVAVREAVYPRSRRLEGVDLLEPIQPAKSPCPGWACNEPQTDPPSARIATAAKPAAVYERRISNTSSIRAAAARYRRGRWPERPSGTRRCSVSEPLSSSKTMLHDVVAAMCSPARKVHF
ncbi:hypothetical protein ACVWXO_001276 [Bradyrhizobium sp. LM2.7]